MALTNGTTVLFGADLKPLMSYKGVLCENINGEWAVKCMRRSDIRGEGDELAHHMCSIIGFSGYTFYNLSTVSENGAIIHRRKGNKDRVQSTFDHSLLTEFNLLSPGRRIYKRTAKSDANLLGKIHENNHNELPFFEMVLPLKSKECLAMYLECAPHTKIPIDTPVPDVTPSSNDTFTDKPPKKDHSKPDVESTTKNDIFDDFTTSPDDETEDIPKKKFNSFSAPWNAYIFINGNPVCNGILIDKFWVIAESSCVNRAK